VENAGKKKKKDENSPDSSHNPASFNFSSGLTDGPTSPDSQRSLAGLPQPDDFRLGRGGSVRSATSRPSVAPYSVAGRKGGPSGRDPSVSAKGNGRCPVSTCGTEVFRTASGGVSPGEIGVVRRVGPVRAEA
jgi:hypothetical protein